MFKRVIHIVAFIVSSVTIVALALAAAVYSQSLPIPEGSRLGDSDSLNALIWAGGIGGVLCATIVATKSAWSFYCWGKQRQLLQRQMG